MEGKGFSSFFPGLVVTQPYIQISVFTTNKLPYKLNRICEIYHCIFDLLRLSYITI